MTNLVTIIAITSQENPVNIALDGGSFVYGMYEKEPPPLKSEIATANKKSSRPKRKTTGGDCMLAELYKIVHGAVMKHHASIGKSRKLMTR